MRYIYISLLAGSALLTAGCNMGKENKVNANDVDVLNIANDSLTLSVDGKELYGFRDAVGSVYLTSGEYKIGVKDSTGKGQEITVKMEAQNDGNEYDKYIFNADKSKSYVLLDVKAAYFPDEDYEVKEKYFNQDYINIKLKTFHFYWPWSMLPNKVYAVEGSTTDIFKLMEVPSDYKDKSDEEIIAYCKDDI